MTDHSNQFFSFGVCFVHISFKNVPVGLFCNYTTVTCLVNSSELRRSVYTYVDHQKLLQILLNYKFTQSRFKMEVCLSELVDLTSTGILSQGIVSTGAGNIFQCNVCFLQIWLSLTQIRQASRKIPASLRLQQLNRPQLLARHWTCHLNACQLLVVSRQPSLISFKRIPLTVVGYRQVVLDIYCTIHSVVTQQIQLYPLQQGFKTQKSIGC